MSVSLSISVRGNPALQAEQALARLSQPAVETAIGTSASKTIRAWLAAKNREPNQMGAPKTGFYASAARGTSWTSGADKVTVTVAKEGFRLRYFGTPRRGLRPVNVDALTVPVIPEARGHSAREFKDLVFIPLKNRGRLRGLLMRPQKGSRFGTVFYLLLAWVRQAADATVLPPLEAIATAIRKQLAQLLKRA